MYIENELVEYVTPGNQEHEEIVKEYEEEVLVQEEFPKPPVTNTADIALVQGKPRCMTFILLITMYIFVMHLRCKN
jgi:D-ribose pyranose/furanose isomerase RbsD